ncbi:MAG: DNA-directed RNA polymerase subunit beta' [Armatimonadota bacterium]
MADLGQFDKIRIGIASPEDIVGWSHGEVKKPETINYRTFKPERDGLFCERIFGPVKDWECHCGRYKKVKYKGLVCERCGVEVTRSRVRRERMGHIELAAPVVHIWYLKGVPGQISRLLDIPTKKLEKVVYFSNFIVIDIDAEGLEKGRKEIEKAVAEEQHAIRSQFEEDENEIQSEFARELEENKDEYGEDEIKERTKAINDRLKAERREMEERVQDLELALKLLYELEPNHLLEEDKYRILDRMLNAVSKRTGKAYREMLHAGIGAAAIKELLSRLDLEQLRRELRQSVLKAHSRRRKTKEDDDDKGIKRLRVVEALIESKTRPEWMVLDVLPVISPELRPMVQLDGGRFATSDLNDLYRRIINRNNRLRKIIEIRAPESIINHEKRLLQEAVDALIDNGRRSRPVTGSNNRPLKSLSDLLEGKEGRFRKNLLGKRVDYSGRSVIVVGPHLKLHQCGLPKEMALELFKPFVMKTLVERKLTQNIKTAKRMIDRLHPAVWDALEEVITEHPVLLNRAPTLHRLGIQAFEPILVDGKAIQVHPLVCHAYNADFDGDQMAVHVPLGAAAQAEARVLMLSTHNLFSPANGGPIVSPIQDIVLGGYALTMVSKEGTQRLNEALEAHAKDPEGAPAPPVYGSPQEVTMLAEHPDPAARIRLNEPVQVRIRRPVGGDAQSEEWESVVRSVTPGQLLFHELLPYPLKHSDRWLGIELTKKNMARLITEIRDAVGAERTIELLDAIKQMGFQWATRFGITVAITDMDPPEERNQIIEETERKVGELRKQYDRGLISESERRQKVLELWTKAYDQVADAILEDIEQFNPLSIVTVSGARGSVKQLTQLAGMRGLMTDQFGNLIEDLPIRSSFHEGLNVFEYFVSTYGARKGLADTALRTADAGYLTRRLVDVAQDVIIKAEDCETGEGIEVCKIVVEGETIEGLGERCRGRTALSTIKDPRTGDVICEVGGIFGEADVSKIDSVVAVFEQELEEAGDDEEALAALKKKFKKAGFEVGDRGELFVPIRSPLTCELPQGICAKCYGEDMAMRRSVEVGVAVGIIAAQSIGEPGTQLTMRTFHTGGIAQENVLAGVKDTDRRSHEAWSQIVRDHGKDILELKSEQLHVLRGITGATEPAEPRKSTARASKGKTAEQVEMDRARRSARSRVKRLVKQLAEGYSGLHRVEEIFEARKEPSGEAIICEHDGVVKKIYKADLGRWVAIEAELKTDNPDIVGKAAAKDIVNPDTGNVEVYATQEMTKKDADRLKKAKVNSIPVLELILVPYRGNLEVKEGDRIRAGDRITTGPLNPHKLLRIRGDKAVQEYIIREVQAVYKAQGVDINDKHIEIICRQMMRKRKIVHPGDTRFLPGELVDRFVLRDENERIQEMIDAGEMIEEEDPGTGETKKRKPRRATADWVLQGIARASLQSESFLSAASFQKTTQVLTEAAIRRKVDNLIGLKENVIIGRLIPAGTGFPPFRNLEVQLTRQPVWRQTLTQIAEEEMSQEISDIYDDETGVDVRALAADLGHDLPSISELAEVEERRGQEEDEE